MAIGHSEAITDKVFGSWSLVCSQHCTLSQATALDPAGRNVVMGVSVYFPREGNKAKIDIRITPDAIEKDGIGIKVDAHPSLRLSMSKCDIRVCLASGFLDEPLLKQMKSGTLAKVAFSRKSQKQILFPLSLVGFQKAFSELEREHHRQPSSAGAPPL